MSQEQKWLSIGSGEGGFQIHRTYAEVERDIFSVIEQIAGCRFGIDDLVGTRIIRKSVLVEGLYCGSMQIHCFNEEVHLRSKIHFHLRHTSDYVTDIRLYHNEWSDKHPRIHRSIHIYGFSREYPSRSFHPVRSIPNSDPYAYDLWLGLPPNFARNREQLEKDKVKFIFH